VPRGPYPDDAGLIHTLVPGESTPPGKYITAVAEPPGVPDPDSPVGRAADGYDELAERADRREDPDSGLWGDSDFQRFYAWPASRDALPDVAGKRVLVAGCGRGDHLDWFLDRGASVVGLDVSERALATARDRFADADATFHRADLTDTLPVAGDAFDLVFSHLVLGHVPEWRPAFEEFARALSPDGRVVATVIHPAYLRRRKDVDRYYDREAFTVDVPGTDIPTYYRPPGAMLDALLGAGFALEAFVEPEPPQEYAEVDPERYADATTSPEVLCLRASLDG
jgi:SAM-dependent methyltransferase